MKMKHLTVSIVIFIMLFATDTLLKADFITDLASGKFSAKSVGKMVSMADSKRYATLKDGQVVCYDFQTGEATDTLFSPDKIKKEDQHLLTDDIQGFQILPNERYMLVYTNRRQLFRRSFEAEYFIYNIAKHSLKPLSQNSPQREPVVSADGRYICFSHKNNLYIHKLDFGTEVAVTTNGSVGQIINGSSDWLYEEEFSTTGQYCFSPDSKYLAYIRLNETEVQQFEWQQMLTDNYPETKQLKYPRAGEKNAKAEVMLYDMHYKSNTKLNISSNNGTYIHRILWRQNASILMVFELNRNQTELSLYEVDAKAQTSKLFLQEKAKEGFADYELAESYQELPDGSWIGLSGQDGFRHLYRFSALGQQEEQLTRGSYDITAVNHYDAKTQTVYFTAARPTPADRSLYSVSLKNKKQNLLTNETGYHSINFIGNGTYYLDNFSTLNTPNRITLVNRTNNKTVRVLEANENVSKAWTEAQMPKKEMFNILTDNGDTLYGWMMLPQHFDPKRKYGLLLCPYGGPASQQVLNRWRTDWSDYATQLGYVVACVDGRGTAARGVHWRSLTYKQVGRYEGEDQVLVAKHFLKQPYIDKNNVCIWGWSFGGFTTINAMQTDTLFRCGMAVAPVTDFRMYDSGYTERFMLQPMQNEIGYRWSDLTRNAKRLHGRLLIVHGLADDNVHAQHTFRYIEELNNCGIQYDMQIYPDDNHFLRKGKHLEHLYRKLTEFLTRKQ